VAIKVSDRHDTFIKQVNRDKQDLEKELEEPVELDEMELEKYIEFVVKEVRKTGQH
jgi:hypothetical protein